MSIQDDNNEDSDQGLIYVDLRVQTKCPYCQHIAEMDFKYEKSAQAIMEAARDSFVDDFLAEVPEGMLGIAYEEEPIEHECENCGRLAFYEIAGKQPDIFNEFFNGEAPENDPGQE